MTDTGRLLSVCPGCGDTFDRHDKNGSCITCQPERGGGTTSSTRPTGSTANRGYGNRWRVLSERARQLQPFCTDCGSPDDLTADHTPAAWIRADAGKTIRLRDIEVVCRRCNAERGAARGSLTGRHKLGHYA